MQPKYLQDPSTPGSKMSKRTIKINVIQITVATHFGVVMMRF